MRRMYFVTIILLMMVAVVLGDNYAIRLGTSQPQAMTTRTQRALSMALSNPTTNYTSVNIYTHSVTTYTWTKAWSISCPAHDTKVVNWTEGQKFEGWAVAISTEFGNNKIYKISTTTATRNGYVDIIFNAK